MTTMEILREIEKNPIILGMKSEEEYFKVKMNPSKVVFTLFGNVSNIIEIIHKLKAMNKLVFVNVDMVSGFSSKNSVIDFLINNSNIDGIISNKPQLLKYAKHKGLFTIHRFFILDSSSWRIIESQIKISNADIINIAPGWTKIIQWTVEKYKKPVIASGLVCDKPIVLENLKAGAIAICSTNHDVWDL
ncbi:MAG: glycerol-3-phosphate responsive antiterminator [Pleomorphochaeta sp.]